MKRFLLLLGILTVAAAAQAKKSSRHADEADGVWKPGTISTYAWDSETNDWKFDHTENYSYNDFGQITEYESDGEYMVTEYTPTGQISIDTTIYPDGDILKTSYTYDEVTGEQTGYITCRREDDQWVTICGEEIRITRNEKGNIIRTDDYTYQTETGEMELAGYYVYSYGDDDKINEITDYVIRDGEPNVEDHLKDIVWENTDNQPIFNHQGNGLYPAFTPYPWVNDNRIKSCTIDDYLGKGAAADMKVEYTDNLGSYKGLISVYGTPIRIHEYSFLDENGSYTDYAEFTDYSVNGSTITIDYVSDYSSVYMTVNKCDSNGNCIEYEYGTPDYKSKTTYDITYDPTYGYPTEVIYKIASNDKVMEKSRIVYGDYALYALYAGAVSRGPMPMRL